MSDEYRKNPADILAEIVKQKAANEGLELTEDFEEQIAIIRDYYNEPVPAKEWTTDYPTKPGYYWLRNYQFKNEPTMWKGAMIVSVLDWRSLSATKDLTFAFSSSDVEFPFTSLITAEWYGPIEPPE